MRQSHTRQAPIAIVLGGACLFSIGIAGCSRNAGLDLAKDEAKTDGVITERANDAILRSKQELAGTPGKSGGKGLATTDPELDEKPSLASRWKAPFKAAGNLLKKSDEDEISDPFLARQQEEASAEQRQIAANASKSTAADHGKTTSPDSKSAAPVAGEKKLAMADSAKSPVANGAKPKPTSSESQAALDAFLKSQEPVGVSDRALAASHETPSLTRKPGTAARPTSAAGSATVALDDSEVEGISKTGVKAGKARPFPGAASGDAAQAPKAVATTRKPTSGTSARNPLAAKPAGVRRNPLAEEAEEPAEAHTRTKQATGSEIAALLKKARVAGEVGEFDEALSYATKASELAEQCSYEFTAREQSPEKVVAWLEAKQEAAAETTIRPKTTERRQIAATRKPAQETAATPTGFEKRTAEEIFADEVDATVAATKQNSGRDSFQEWAAGVGKTPIAKGSSPNWPVLSPRELAASDDLWQPSRTEFQQQWTDLRGNVAPKDQKKPAETRLASAETDAPVFVATAEAEQATPAIASTRSRDPIVQLGEPTDLAPGAIAHSGRRGPRLAAPPPLSIEDAATPHVVAKSTRASNQARTIWFAVVGGLAVLVLLAFRRWAYRSTVE